MRVVFRVSGRPVPQGSMVATYNRRMGVAHVHHVQGQALAQWRASIREGALRAGAKIEVGPVLFSVRFGMQRPKSHMTLRGGKFVVKMDHYYDLPAVQPDLDKLLRAAMDALTGVCYADDGQVTGIYAEKVYSEFTEIVVSDASMAWKEDASEVEENPSIDTGPRQLRLQDMWDGER